LLIFTAATRFPWGGHCALSRFQRLRGLAFPTAPTGVSHLQRKSTVRENNTTYENINKLMNNGYLISHPHKSLIYELISQKTNHLIYYYQDSNKYTYILYFYS
jgi:hypothetical protein